MPYVISQSATDHNDLLDKILEFITSQSATAAPVNAAGTGYSIDDVLTVSGGTSTIAVELVVTAEAATSATVSAGGTGYTVNDQLTVSGGTFGSAAVFNVDSVSGGAVTAVSLVSGGDYTSTPANPASTTGGTGSGCTLNVTYGGVATVRISQSGAYTSTPSNPVSVTGGGGSGATFDLTFNSSNGWTINRRTKEAVSATVSAGGTGYTVNDQLTVAGGVDVNTAAVFNVDTVSGGAVTAVSLVTAGKYGETPANPASTTGGTGSGCTLTVTYQNHVSSEFDALIEGEGSGTDEIFVGLRTFISGSAHNLELRGATGYDSGAPFGTQPGISPGDHEAGLSADQDGTYVPLDNSAITYWLFASGRRIIGVFKVGASTYTSMYVGFIDPFGTASDFPYPLLIAGCSSLRNRLFSSNDSGYSGMLDPISDDGDTFGPAGYRDPAGQWNQVHNSQGAGSGRNEKLDFVVLPAGVPDDANLSTDDKTSNGTHTFDDLIPNEGAPGTATDRFKQTPDSPDPVSALIPAFLVRAGDGGSIPRDAHGFMDGVYWSSADIDGQSAIAQSEDTFTDENGVRYHIFQNCNRTELFSFFALEEK